MRKKLLTASQRQELEAIDPERRLRFFWRVRTSMLAFDARSGELAWRTRPVRGSTRNDLASPIMGSFAGQATIVWPTGTQIAGVRPDDGEVLWQFDYAEAFALDRLGPSHANVMPLIVGDRIIGNLWNHKASNRTFCVRVGADGPRLQWQTPLMVSWYHGYVVHDGMVLGVDNQGVYKGQGPNLPATRPEDTGILQSYDLKSGRVLWHTNEIGAAVTGKRVHTSRPAYIVADGKLILQNHRSVSMLKIDRDGAKVVGMVDNLGRGRAYSLPALSDGRLYIRRTSGPLYCFDIREKPE
jgi:outer membrane protein assembly factor BamB